MQTLKWLVPCALALGGVALPAAAGKVKPQNDVSVKMKIASGNTLGPVAKLKLKNKGTASQTGVVIRIYGENENGPELWTGTVDIPARKSAKVDAQVFLDQDTTALCAEVELDGNQDEVPSDNVARGGLGLKGKAAKVLAGRSAWTAMCASCHGEAAGGGDGGPAVAGATSSVLLRTIASGGDHDFPTFSKTDAKNVGLFLKDPANVTMPPPLPEPPEGGWPTYESGGVKALLDARCVRCHGPGRTEAGVWLSTFDSASKASSRALAAVKKGTMPQEDKRFTADEIALLQDWITGGRRP